METEGRLRLADVWAISHTLIFPNPTVLFLVIFLLNF